MTLKETIEERIETLTDELPPLRYASLQAYQAWLAVKAAEDKAQNELDSMQKILEDMP